MTNAQYFGLGCAFTILVLVMAWCLVILTKFVVMMVRIFWYEFQTRKATKIIQRHRIARAIEYGFKGLHIGRNRHEDGPHR